MSRNSKSRKILLIANEGIKKNMTGPAIRCWEFARVLNKYFSVTLAVPPTRQSKSNPTELAPSFAVALCKTTAELKKLVQDTDVVITLGVNLSVYPFLTKIDKPLVVDMYIPFIFEGLQNYQDQPMSQRLMHHEASRGAHTLQIRSADFIICASEKQKDFWLGWLAALGRVNPHTHRHDPTFANLIDVVPFGLPREAPVATQPALKGTYKNIGSNDRVILWGGGIWNWLDYKTLIEAVAVVATRQPEVKLFFMGVKSPNPLSAEMGAPARAMKMSQALGLFNKQIFFNDWVAYDERQNYLLEADIGASLHLNHIETRFSFRTRLLDYIWTGLPILATEGDMMSEVVARWNLGKVVKSGDVSQVCQAVIELLNTPNLREAYQPRFEQIRAKYEWETVMAPLLQFCESPYLGADKSHLRQIPPVQHGVSAWWLLPSKILRTIRLYGSDALAYKVQEYIRWKLGRWQ